MSVFTIKRLDHTGYMISWQEWSSHLICHTLELWDLQERKKKSPCGEMHPNYAMLVLCRAGHGKAVDGVEADITGPPPHAKIGTLRRNLYCRNHVRTSYDTPDGLRSREGQASLCWLLCSERGPSPERKKKSPTYIRNTIKAENVILKPQVRRPQCCINELLSLK